MRLNRKASIITALISGMIVFLSCFCLFSSKQECHTSLAADNNTNKQLYYDQKDLGYDSYAITGDGTTELVSAGQSIDVLSSVSSIPSQTVDVTRSDSSEALNQDVNDSSSLAVLYDADNDISVLSSSYPSYGITETSQTMIKGGEKYDFLSGIGTTPDKSSWVDGDEFRTVVTNVTGESGCSYKYKNGDASFTPSKNDDGKTYTVYYKLQKKHRGATPGMMCSA